MNNHNKSVYKTKKCDKAVCNIFANWEETLIWSCLQNVMGEVFVNDINNPTAAMAVLGDFCFLGGIPDENLVIYKPDLCKRNFTLMVPQSVEWGLLIEKCYREKAKKVVRYAFEKEKDIFDKKTLETVIAKLPKEYQIKMIDKFLFMQCEKLVWCEDFVSQYDDYSKYQDYGIGVVILKDNEIVSGASSYASYNGGIEIEIDTRYDYRRRGLAYIAGAKLILSCLERGLYPSWDAQNKWSAKLAEKLGYNFSHEYTAYEICGY